MPGSNAKKFGRLLEPRLTPVLLADGFLKRGVGWIRVRDPIINWLDVQSRSDDEACCVNLGVHLTFLPRSGASTGAAGVEIGHADCAISHRLAWDPGNDHWWSYDGAEVAADDLVTCYMERGRKHFDQYMGFPHPFVDVTPQDIDTKGVNELFPMTKTLQLLLMARVNDYLGNGPAASCFSEIGLKTAPKIASGPRFAFKQILKKTPGRA